MNEFAKTSVNAFIFDFFGVLARYDDEILCRRLSLSCAEPDQALRYLTTRSWDDICFDRITLLDLHAEFQQALSLTLTFSSFEAAWAEPYSIPMPGMNELLRELSSSYRLVLLSNVDRHYWQAACSNYAELKHFGALVLSFEIGLGKPDATAFLEACHVTHSEPSRCFLVDDKPTNIEAARALGISGHVFTTTERLRTDLRAQGII